MGDVGTGTGVGGLSERDIINGKVAVLVGFYNDVLAPRGFSFPAHLFPVAKALCDNRIKKLMLILGPGSGKSQLTTVIYPAFALGDDPSLTILEVSGGEALVKDFMKASMDIIEYSPAFRELFPDVRPDKDRTWSMENGAIVTGHGVGDPDASLYAGGIDSRTIPGKHGKLIILDDLHNRENSSSEIQCEKIVSAYYSTLLGRADPGGARFVITGRRWHENDIYGTLQRSGDWTVLRLPFERPKIGAEDWLYYDVFVPEGDVNIFTEDAESNRDLDWGIDNGERTSGNAGVRMRHLVSRYGKDAKGQGFFWPNSDQKRSEYFAAKRARPSDTEAFYQCNPGARTGAIFLQEYFSYYVPPEHLALGLHGPGVMDWLPDNAQIFQAWDTAWSAESDADYSVCVTGAFIPCKRYHRGEDEKLLGPCEDHMDVLILDVYRERLGFVNLVPQIRIEYRKWRPIMVLIENKQSGIGALSVLAKSNIVIEPVKADINKRARAIAGTEQGSVQGWYSMGRVHHPELPEGSWVSTFERELKDFAGDGSGRDDQVDAVVHLVNHAIRLGGGASMMSSGWATGNNKAIDKNMGIESADMNMAGMGPLVMAYGSLIDKSSSPWGDTCSTCGKFKAGRCDLTKHVMLPMDSCGEHTSGANWLIGGVDQI